MKKLLGILLCLGILAGAVNAFAQNGETKRFAVLPFQIHGPESYKYLGKGIQTMLKSRLFWDDRFVPVDDSRIKVSSSDVTSSGRAGQILMDLEADYLFWGSVTILSDQASIDLNILDAQESFKSRSWQTSLSNLIPSMESRAKGISKDIFKRPVEVAEAEVAAEAESKDRPVQPKSGERPSGSQRMPSGSGRPPSEYIQKEERQSGFIEKKRSRSEQGRWRSRRFSFESRGLVVGDGDGDARNEIFILTGNTVYACIRREGGLEMKAEYKTSRRLQCLNINLIDLDGDKDSEIVVSAIQDEEMMHSFILDYQKGQLQVMHEGIRKFLNVVKKPPQYEKILIGQAYNPSKIFYGPVNRVTVSPEGIQLGEALDIPDKANVSNFAFLPQENSYKIVVVDIFNKIRVYTPNDTIQYTTNEKYAASTIKVKIDSTLPGIEYKFDPQKFYYIASRLVPHDFNGDGNHELMVNRNISIAADLLPRFRHYPKGEIHSLYWDGMGLSLDWKTKTIQGTVVDYGIGDMDNDHDREVYVCVNTYPGLSNLKEIKTIIMAYSLEPVVAEGPAPGS